MNLNLQKTHVNIQVDSPNTTYTDEFIFSNYDYHDTFVEISDQVKSKSTFSNCFKDNRSSCSCLCSSSMKDGVCQCSSSVKTVIIKPTVSRYQFKLKRSVPKMGLMLVGWGGNNGSTLTASLLAHKNHITWRTKSGIQYPNFLGSILMASTLNMGCDVDGNSVFVPFHSLLPMVDPTSIIIGGWDISSVNIGKAMERACVLEPDLQSQLFNELSKLCPLPSIYNPEFIAENQADRADNLITGTSQEQLDVIRRDIRSFKSLHSLDTVIVMWTATTERFSDIIDSVNGGNAETLLKAIQAGHPEISPSTIFGTAAILEHCPFINGSPQNTFVPGLIDLALREGVSIGGDDFKSGQTKLKSVLVDFLVGAGIKPRGITSYNHLGNNDGKNLSAHKQFRSKEITKSNVVDDMVESNSIMYAEGEKPDHVVVIKYIPSVGDSKRALDEYENEIFMGGRNTISIHNTCEDSLLAAPLMLDLAILTELLNRVSVRKIHQSIENEFEPLHPILSHLSYLLKAPIVPAGVPVVNALFKQRLALENFFRALLGLPPQTEMNLPSRLLTRHI